MDHAQMVECVGQMMDDLCPCCPHKETAIPRDIDPMPDIRSMMDGTRRWDMKCPCPSMLERMDAECLGNMAEASRVFNDLSPCLTVGKYQKHQSMLARKLARRQPDDVVRHEIDRLCRYLETTTFEHLEETQKRLWDLRSIMGDTPSFHKGRMTDEDIEASITFARGKLEDVKDEKEMVKTQRRIRNLEWVMGRRFM
jgi:hypothetical protein